LVPSIYRRSSSHESSEAVPPGLSVRLAASPCVSHARWDPMTNVRRSHQRPVPAFLPIGLHVGPCERSGSVVDPPAPARESRPPYCANLVQGMCATRSSAMAFNQQHLRNMVRAADPRTGRLDSTWKVLPTCLNEQRDHLRFGVAVKQAVPELHTCISGCRSGSSRIIRSTSGLSPHELHWISGTYACDHGCPSSTLTR
jgi:hypothetical protein